MIQWLLIAALAAGPGPRGYVPPLAPTYALTRTVVTTVTTANGWASIYPWQRKTFYMAGLYWMFYGDTATDIEVYRTSADAVTWSSATTIRTTTTFGDGLGHRIGYWFDGTFLHYAACDAGDGDDILYRRGTPNSNGTITWSAAEQTVLAVDAAHAGGYPTVFADTTGAPWVGIVYAAAPSWTAPFKGHVFKSSTTDGTWTTAATFPKEFISNNTIYPVPVCVPLLAGKVYCTYANDANTTTFGMAWSGSAWGSEETIGVSVPDTLRGIVADGDVIHYAYETNPAAVVEYRQRSAGGNWSSAISVTGAALSACCTHLSLTVLDSQLVRIYWNNTSNVVRYRDVRANVAAGTTDLTLWDESTPTLANVLQPNAMSFSTAPVVSYTTKAVSPFDVVVVKQVKK